MATIAHRNHTVGDVRQYFVSYDEVMRRGDWITIAAVTSSTPDAVITGKAIIEPHKIMFFVGGGVLNEDFTVSLIVTDNNSEIFNDTMAFHVVAP